MGPPTGAPVTRVLCVLILVVSLVAALTGRRYGFGTDGLNFQVGAVLAGQVWRIITYPFVESSPQGLVFGLIALWFFGSSFENRWGERDFLRFFLVASAGAAVLAIPLSLLIDALLPMNDIPIAEGPGPALNAMLVALALTMPDSNVLFGFMLPIRTRTLVIGILAYQLIVGIMSGAAQLSVTLGGMGMGYLLVTGNWRPRRWFDSLRLRRMQRRNKRGLYVVPPRKDNTLH